MTTTPATHAPTTPPRTGGPLERLLAFGTLPLVATVFSGIVGLYIAIVAFGNITDFGTNQAFVQHVFEMDTTFDDDDLTWRAIDSSLLQDIAYIGIIIAESAAALVLLWATTIWIRAHRNPALVDRARRASTLGFVLMILIFGLGFITIGGEWFAMWQSSQWNGLDPALQNLTMAAFGLVLIHLPSAQWGHDQRGIAATAS